MSNPKCVVCEGGDEGYVCAKCYAPKVVLIFCRKCQTRTLMTVQEMNEEFMEQEIVFFPGMVFCLDEGCPYCTEEDNQDVLNEVSLITFSPEYTN